MELMQSIGAGLRHTRAALEAGDIMTAEDSLDVTIGLFESLDQKQSELTTPVLESEGIDQPSEDGFYFFRRSDQHSWSIVKVSGRSVWPMGDPEIHRIEHFYANEGQWRQILLPGE